MMHPRRRALVLVILGAIPVIAAAQLNPTVKVLPRPKSAVPAECDQGLAIQPAQRLTTEERTAVRDTSRDMQAPPTASLKGELEAAFVAAQHSSRQAFRDALTQAKSLLVSYPPGGERTAASNLVEVLDDIDRIWEYQFTSPTGAFFDSSSEPFRIASKYPGYDAAIRRQIITDQNGNKFYPAHETRDFLIAESGQRLPRVTGKPAPPPRPAPRAALRAAVAPSPETTTKPKPQHTMKQTTTTKTATTHATTHATRPSHRRAKHKPVVEEARATPPAPRTTAQTTPPHPKPVQTTPPPKPVTEVAPTHPPIVSETAAKTPPPTTSSASTATPESATSTTATTIAPTETTTTTAATESNPGGKPAQSRSLLGPILLIIVGVGLLLTLWRASS